MSNFITGIAGFFKGENKMYFINSSPGEVINAIRSIPRETGLWSKNDFELKSWDERFFSIRLVSLNTNPGVRLSSRLYGEINKDEEGKTIIKIKIKGSPQIYALFFLGVILSLIYIIKFIIYENELKHLLLISLIFILLLYLCMWYKRVTEYTIQERFKIFLKEKFGNDISFRSN